MKQKLSLSEKQKEGGKGLDFWCKFGGRDKVVTMQW